jgi:hypothetical protein
LSRVAIAAVLSPAAPIDRSSPSFSGVHGDPLISSPSARARPGGGWLRSGLARRLALPPRRRRPPAAGTTIQSPQTRSAASPTLSNRAPTDQNRIARLAVQHCNDDPDDCGNKCANSNVKCPTRIVERLKIAQPSRFVFFCEPIFDIAARDIAALKPGDAGTAAGTALKEFKAYHCRGEGFQFGALLVREHFYFPFALSLDHFNGSPIL